MNHLIDQYLAQGCGRCPLGGTPNCKVHTWEAELSYLRKLILECGLIEELKWSVPTYTYNQQNVIILAAFKEYTSLSFIKGALLKDDAKLLVQPGENSQASRLFAIKSLAQAKAKEQEIKAYIFEAIEIEKAGLKIDFKAKHELELIPELLEQFEKMPEFKAAFEALTPGKQRGYHLHFAQAKQSATRTSRIQKYIPLILQCKGFHDEYKSRK
jgi:uncharacterized protein YdeI (YjbR/CyaY-like superfamily)